VITNPTVNPPSNFPFAGIAQNLVSALEGGIPEKAPFGLERIDWDPETGSCSSIWSNPDISVPNGIPSISEASQMVYGIGQRDGQWGLEGLDFDTGASRLWVEGGAGTCPQALFDTAGLLPGAEEVLQMVPDSCENSAYSATTIGPDGMVYTGTISGVSRYIPAATEPLPPVDQVDAGIDQGLDLLARAESGNTTTAISVRDFLRRAMVQVSAASEASKEGGIGVTPLLNEALRSIDEAVAALDAGDSIDPFVVEARDALLTAKAAL
jgi:hypothetical protein